MTDASERNGGITTEVLALLAQRDTPTICNAIEVAQGKRGFDGFTHRTMIATAPAMRPMVGFARTARIASLSPDADTQDAIRARRLAYFRHMSEAPVPSIAVIEDVDGDASIGAWWGEVHVGVHRRFGLSGAVTNGLARDLDQGRDDFPILCGGVGPSHGFVHVKDFGAGATVFGCAVAEGALVHADRHGMVCIPTDIAPLLPAAIEKLDRSEAVVLSAVETGWEDFDAFAAIWKEFEAVRT